MGAGRWRKSAERHCDCQYCAGTQGRYQFFYIVASAGAVSYCRALFSISPAWFPICKFHHILEKIADEINRENQRKTIICYFADAIMSISKNTAMLVNGEYVQTRLADLLEPPDNDNRSSEEIIEDISAKLEKIGGLDNSKFA